ncbi:hypothetical protein ABVK25_011484 [Lepraria finkii]|uniref:Uncharacterized protein n=1 Tax=Lepraria finkii TaxID=1340010 RepID=A0ABR4ANY7_9LECA
MAFRGTKSEGETLIETNLGYVIDLTGHIFSCLHCYIKSSISLRFYHQSASLSIDVRLCFLAIRVRRPSDHTSGFATSQCSADIIIFRLLYIGNYIGNISSTRMPRHEA